MRYMDRVSGQAGSDVAGVPRYFAETGELGGFHNVAVARPATAAAAEIKHEYDGFIYLSKLVRCRQNQRVLSFPRDIRTVSRSSM